MPGESLGHPSAAVARHGAPLRPVAGEGRALTEQQQRFIFHFTSDPGSIGNAAESARRAGFSVTSAREIGRQLLHKPHIQEAVRAANLQQISGQIATKAIALLEKVIDDDTAPLKTRIEAAKTILDRAGYAASPTGPKRLSDKALAEMTADELRQVMVEARKEMDRGLVVVDGAAVAGPDAPTPAQPILDAAATSNFTMNPKDFAT